MPARPARSDWTDRVSSALSSTVVNTGIGILGLAVPFTVWILGRASLKTVVLAIETVLLLLVVVRHQWLRRAYLQLRRANSRAMADSHYFDAMRVKLESELIDSYDEVADGHLRVFASEVPRISILLIRTLMEVGSEPQRVTATDLTTDPQLLTSRREYLAINRRFIESGGSILRVFICRLADLTEQGFAGGLLTLIDYHRSLGVQCGLALRDWLRADEAVDFVVISLAAVLIEDEQGDIGYTSGRSSVSFKGVEKWAEKFNSIWQPHAAPPAPLRLQRYESEVRRMLAIGKWDQSSAKESLEHGM